jgi:hypothetical protein
MQPANGVASWPPKRSCRNIITSGRTSDVWMKVECGFGCMAANLYSPPVTHSRLVLSGVGYNNFTGACEVFCSFSVMDTEIHSFSSNYFVVTGGRYSFSRGIGLSITFLFQWWTHGSFCFLFLSLVPDWELFYHRSVYFHLNVVSFQQKYRGLAGVNSALWIVVSFSLLNCCLAMQGFGLFSFGPSFFAPNKNRP